MNPKILKNMTKLLTYLLVFLMAMLQTLCAQQSFEDQAKAIGINIQKITKETKEKLKTDIKTLEESLQKGDIDQSTFEAQKQTLASMSALEMEQKIGVEEAKLLALVKNTTEAEMTTYHDTITGKTKDYEIIVSFNKNKKNSSQKDYIEKGEKRTTSQFVFALGLNNAISNNNFGTLEESDFSIWKSRFYEWGFTYNTRLLKNHNLLHAKYGISVMYNNLSPTNNRFFEVQDNQTNLQTAELSLRRSRLRNVYLVLPLHL